MANTISGDLKVTGDLQIGNATSPPVASAGSGAINTTNKANGSLHLRTDTDTVPEVMHNGASEKLGFAQSAVEARMGDLTANSAVTYTTYMPRDMKITGVSRRYTVAPASAAGTVVVGITVGGNQVLASASENDEGLANDTLTAHSLTSTSADLIVSKGDKVVITVTSNNADMSGGTDPMYYLYTEDN